MEGVHAKNLEVTLLFVDFSKAFDSRHRGKVEQILLAYGLLKETIAAIMMLYKNTKVKVHSPDRDTDFFDMVAGILQGDSLTPYLFIICLEYVLQMSIDSMKENGFPMEKARSRRYPVQTITDTNSADDIVLLANTPAQAKSLLHCLKKASRWHRPPCQADKTEYMYFNPNQREDIFTLKGGSLKLVDKFTYLGSSVSSTKNDINTQLVKA